MNSNDIDEDNQFFISDVYKPGRKSIACANWSSAVWYKNYCNENILDWNELCDEEENPSGTFYVCKVADVIPLTFGESGPSELEDLLKC